MMPGEGTIMPGEGGTKVIGGFGVVKDGADRVCGVVGVRHWFRDRNVWDPFGVTGVEIREEQAEGGRRRAEELARSGRGGRMS